MYPQFFGFDKLPFRLRPDPDFLYSGPEYQSARAMVIDELRGTSRVVLLTGPAGVGKTLLLEEALREIRGQFRVCRINQPHISAPELIQALMLQLGSSPADAEANRALPFTELAAALGSIVAREAAPLLVIDDAQWLTGATLRTFGDILARAPRLKILLAIRSGQQLRIEEFASRTGISEEPRRIELQPFSAEAAKSYIERRLAVAGCGAKELFEADAYAMIYQHTGGAARLINVLCDAALHAACLRASGHVGAAEISVATQDSRWPEAVARDKAIPAAAADEEAGTAAAAPDAHAQLLLSHGAEHIATWPLRPGRLSIGRAADNEVQLEARYVSRHHCQVVTVGSVSTIDDLGSVNGLCVNGTVVKHHVLQHADRITLGEHALTYLVT